MEHQPLVMIGFVGVVGLAAAMILLSGSGATKVEEPSPEVLQPVDYAPPSLAVQTAPEVVRRPKPVRVQEAPVQAPPEPEPEVDVTTLQGSSGIPVDRPQTESEQDIMMSLPRQRLSNGSCPGEKFRRTVPGGGPFGGMPLSDCEPYPGQPSPQGRPSQGVDGDGAANVKIKGYNCDTQASGCRKACLQIVDLTPQQLCRTDCELDKARCIQGI